jgi:hypothetical protein
MTKLIIIQSGFSIISKWEILLLWICKCLDFSSVQTVSLFLNPTKWKKMKKKMAEESGVRADWAST